METGFVFAGGAVCGGMVVGFFMHRRSQLRGRLLSFVAHEVNTPVSALNMTILNFLDGLFGNIPEDQRPWLILMREQVARLGALVGDLRDLVHEEFHDDLALTPESVALAPIIERSLSDMEEAMKRSEASVKTDIPDSLPMLHADPDRLSRIVISILSHARKFRAKGAIDLSVRSEGRRQTLQVQYSGSEAERRTMDRALELFYPAYMSDSQILHCTGVGLGLPNRLVKAHGGEMRLTANGEIMSIEIEMPEASA